MNEFMLGDKRQMWFLVNFHLKKFEFEFMNKTTLSNIISIFQINLLNFDEVYMYCLRDKNVYM